MNEKVFVDKLDKLTNTQQSIQGKCRRGGGGLFILVMILAMIGFFECYNIEYKFIINGLLLLNGCCSRVMIGRILMVVVVGYKYENIDDEYFAYFTNHHDGDNRYYFDP